MRVLPLLSLSALALAQEAAQNPLLATALGYFEKLKAKIPSPIDAGASAVAAANVNIITINNWREYLTPKPDQAEEWLVYTTGGNKTCFGRCEHANKVWNQSVAVLSVLPDRPGSPNLRLGSIDCEKSEILCTAWSVGVPTIWHFLLPSTPDTPSDLRIIRLNTTTATVQNITSIPSRSDSRYKNYEPYEGALHPIDGLLARFNLTIPLGYALWGLGAVPSWLMMIVISFASRQIMNKRMKDGPGGIEAASAEINKQKAAGAGGAPAAAPASPAGGQSQGGRGKKRR